MAESAASILSSYSQQQEDPFRCLTSSITLGRYMSESLDWEKWSTFTENRYMEDVNKYSRPGYVAQMKAHFEAHYERKVAKGAATLLQQCKAVYKSNVDQESVQTTNQVSIVNAREAEATRNMDSIEISRCTPLGGEGRAPEGSQFVEAEEDQLVDQVDNSNCLELVEYDQTIGGCSQNIDGRKQGCTQFVEVENSHTSDKVDVCVQLEGIEDDKKGASLDTRKPIFLPFKSRDRIGVPKPPAPPIHSVPIKERQNRKANSGSRENAEDVETRKAPTRSFHMFPDFAPKETKKPSSSILQTLVNFTFKSRAHIGVPKSPAPPNLSVPFQKRQNKKANSGSRDSVAEVENRKEPTRPLMSPDLAPKETKEPLFPIRRRLVNSRLVKTLAGKAAQATEGKTLQDTIDIPAHPSVSLLQKKFSSLMSTSTCTRNVLSHTVSRPFSFKNEERAAKQKEGDPFHCLTSSISLGRYMSESLEWEKYSPFTENRYMEDVKKCSRPGSVAQLKAHFEAHHKKKAAERTATLLEQHNAVYRSNVEMQMENLVSIGKTWEEEATRNMVTDSVEISRCTPLDGEGRARKVAQFVEAEENQLVDQVDISNCLENVEYDQAIGSCNQNIDRREHDSPQSVEAENSLTSDKVYACVQLKSIEDDKKGAYSEDGKTRTNLGSKENDADVENRKTPTRSLHMSVDRAPKETKKLLSSILQRLVDSRLVKTLAGMAAKDTQAKTFPDTVDIPVHQAVILQQKKISSKSTSTCTRNTQSCTVPCPFSFKSEERAAKRKEFFHRLEQNAKAKETEKDKLQENSKVKARSDFKYKHLLPTSKVRPCSDSFPTTTPSDA